MVLNNSPTTSNLVQDLGDHAIQAEGAELVPFQIPFVSNLPVLTAYHIYGMWICCVRLYSEFGCLAFDILVHQFAMKLLWDSPCYEVADEPEEVLSSRMRLSSSRDGILIGYEYAGVAHNNNSSSSTRASKRSYMNSNLSPTSASIQYQFLVR